MEHRQKIKAKVRLRQELAQLLQNVKNLVSFIDYICIRKLLRNSKIAEAKKVNTRHAKTITNLKGRQNVDVKLLDNDKVVVNLSKQKLTDAEVAVLSRGLSFSIPPPQLDKTDVMTSFETLYRQSPTGLLGNIQRFKHRIRNLCYSYIYSYDAKKCCNLPRTELAAYKDLLKRKDIVICKPDKGNGVVILDR